MNLRAHAQGQNCVRCGHDGSDGTVVLAHYTGARRLAYRGGYGLKSNDLCAAHLCGPCHEHMDRLSREKETKWEHSEEFQHYVLLTILRLWDQGVIRT